MAQKKYLITKEAVKEAQRNKNHKKQKTSSKMAGVNPTMSRIKSEWSKQPNRKAKSFRMDKKRIQLHAVNKRHTLYLRSKEKDGGKRKYYKNSNHKRARIVI